MSTSTIVRILMATVITVAIVAVLAAIILPIVTGPEDTAWKQLGESINDVCASSTGTVKQLSVYMPDSKGSTSLNLVFFYLAVDQNNFILARRTYGVEKNDILVNFVDFIRNKPGNQMLKETTLKNCLNNKIHICGQVDPNDPNSIKCDKFQFESEEGKESLSFTINKTTDYQVLLSYMKMTVCGDGRCCNKDSGCPDCTPQENSDNCPADCEEANPCKPMTEG